MPNVYYSVGQNSNNNSSGGNVSITSGVATFTVAQTVTNLGVGDRLTAGGNVYYLKTKNSTTSWVVVNALGNAPGDLELTAVTSIAHEYTSLSAAIAGAVDANHLNNTSLVTTTAILRIPCYYDTGDDTTLATIDGYTTSASYYHKIYTPTNTTTECNQRQRHDGKWTAGRYAMSYDTTAAGNKMINILDSNVWIDGLQIKMTATHDFSVRIQMGQTSANTSISNCYLEHIGTSNVGASIMAAEWYTTSMNVWNTVCVSNSTYNHARNVHISSPGTATAACAWNIYNCTLYGSYRGIYYTGDTGKTINAINCLVANSVAANYSNAASWGSSNYNASSDATVPGGAQDRASQTFTFADVGGKDFDLASNDGGARDYGVTDPGAGLFSDDIKGRSRPYGAAWDIGAFEYVAAGGLSIPVAMNSYRLRRI